MSVNRRATSCAALSAILIAAVAATQCGSASSPTSSSTVRVALAATSIAAGSTAQGTVSLAAPAPTAGSSISLSSNNPAVATVQTSVMVPAGSSSAPITVTGVSAGTATITASFNGNTSQAVLTVTAGAAVVLSSISLDISSVVGGEFVNGRATLSAAAPAGGAVVSLSGSDPVSVPQSVTVPAGSVSATFAVTTRVVGGSVSTTITGVYGGASASATLVVTPPTVATARFGVSGPTETETCTLTNNGNTLNCTFNGSTSTAPGTITAWDWSYGVATTFTQTTSGPVLTTPTVNCSLLPPPPLPAGTSWFTMVVTLKVHDNLGNVSAEARNSDVRLIPRDVCGF